MSRPPGISAAAPARTHEVPTHVIPMDLARSEAAAALLQLHVVTPWLPARHVGHETRARRSGHILLVSSISALRGFPGIAIYGSSKQHLISFAKSLQEELRPWGVTVTCVAPGATTTGLDSHTAVPVTTAVRYGLMSDPAPVARVVGWGMRLIPRWLLRAVRMRSGLLPVPPD